MDWFRFKEELKKLPLGERLVELQILLKTIKNKELKNLVKKEIKKITSEIQKKRDWKAEGSISFFSRGVEQVVRETSGPTRLEQVVEESVEDKPKQEQPAVTYTAGGDYLGGYFKESYELQGENKRPESPTWEVEKNKDSGAAGYTTRNSQPREETLNRSDESFNEKEESEKMRKYHRGEKNE